MDLCFFEIGNVDIIFNKLILYLNLVLLLLKMEYFNVLLIRVK
ncbi:unnamed protein product [Paramecium sonneborni]|uniref:Uncharacterized protein n=1 Tax=Paramecium sonneborni TaxID=65129 RepID=A0A8S1RVG1_9CILI|nr:unnamed protein product [Paramecium sonneborni]